MSRGLLHQTQVAVMLPLNIFQRTGCREWLHPTLLMTLTDTVAALTAIEAQILTLHQQGASHAKICEAVWGYKSSNKYPEIDAVLAKFNQN